MFYQFRPMSFDGGTNLLKMKPASVKQFHCAASIAFLKNCAKHHLSDFVDSVGPWKSSARITSRSLNVMLEFQL